MTIAAGATTASSAVTAVKDQLAEPAAEVLLRRFGTLPAGITDGHPSVFLLAINDAPTG